MVALKTNNLVIVLKKQAALQLLKGVWTMCLDLPQNTILRELFDQSGNFLDSPIHNVCFHFFFLAHLIYCKNHFTQGHLLKQRK